MKYADLMLPHGTLYADNSTKTPVLLMAAEAMKNSLWSGADCQTALSKSINHIAKLVGVKAESVRVYPCLEDAVSAIRNKLLPVLCVHKIFISDDSRAVFWNEFGKLALYTTPIPIRWDSGDLEDGEWDTASTDALVSFPHVSAFSGQSHWSNIVNTKTKAWVVVDGSDAVGHMPVNLKEIPCDYYMCSGSLMYGPPCGVVVMNSARARGAGLKDVPTDAIFSTACGLGVAAEFLMSRGMDRIQTHESELTVHLRTDGIGRFAGLRVLGRGRADLPVVCVDVPAETPDEFYKKLTADGLDVSCGTHGCPESHKSMRCTGSVRVSLGWYHELDDVTEIVRIFKKNVPH